VCIIFSIPLGSYTGTAGGFGPGTMTCKTRESVRPYAGEWLAQERIHSGVYHIHRQRRLVVEHRSTCEMDNASNLAHSSWALYSHVDHGADPIYRKIANLGGSCMLGSTQNSDSGQLLVDSRTFKLHSCTRASSNHRYGSCPITYLAESGQ